MRIIGFIEDEHVTKKILRHLELREIPNHAPPNRNLQYILCLTCYDDYSQVPAVDYWLHSLKTSIEICH